MRISNALNPGELRTLGEGEHCDGLGLYLVVNGSGGRSWIMKYTHGKKPQKIGLGSLDDVSLKAARGRRDEIRVGLTKGIDPKEERVQAKVWNDTAPMFLDFATDFVKEHVKNLKNAKSGEKWFRTINDYCLPLHAKRISQIDIDDVIAVLAPRWNEIPQAMRDCRSHLEQILAAAVVKKHRPRNEMNPAQLKGNLAAIPPFKPKKGAGKAKRNHPSMPYDQVPAFLAELRRKETLCAWMMETVILTACRSAEAIQMTWDQIDFDKAKWTIPGKIMKNGLEATVPLTDTVLARLREIKALGLPGDYVFAGQKAGLPMSHNAMLRVLQISLKRPDCTMHGFRASFRSWGQNETNHSHETMEFCLHHITGDEAARAYKNGDMWAKRMAALKDWEAYVNTPAPVEPAQPHLRLVSAA